MPRATHPAARGVVQLLENARERRRIRRQANCPVVHWGMDVLKTMKDKFKELIRMTKIILAIIFGAIALGLWLAYNLANILGVPKIKI
jgi:hypothetical protein